MLRFWVKVISFLILILYAYTAIEMIFKIQDNSSISLYFSLLSCTVVIVLLMYVITRKNKNG